MIAKDAREKSGFGGDSGPLWTTEDVQKLTGWTPTTVARRVRDGLPAYQFSPRGPYFFFREEVLDWIRSFRVANTGLRIPAVARIVQHLRLRGRQLIDQGAPGGAPLIDEADRIEHGGRLLTPEDTER